MTDHEVLFVAGLARSGTTALQRILDPHPDIALGLERYKALWGERVGEITAASFERAAFFDWSQDLTNITPEVAWAADRIALLDAKWDTARYRGDKMTIIRAQRLWESIPSARFVFIVRDAAEVASSWERRANNAEDAGWRRDLGALGSIQPWNTAIGRIHRAVKQRPEQAMVLEYARFFGDPEATGLRAVARFLDLDVEPLLPEFLASQQQYVGSVRRRDRSLPDDVLARIEADADHATWAKVLELAQ